MRYLEETQSNNKGAIDKKNFGCVALKRLGTLFIRYSLLNKHYMLDTQRSHIIFNITIE